MHFVYINLTVEFVWLNSISPNENWFYFNYRIEMIAKADFTCMCTSFEVSPRILKPIIKLFRIENIQHSSHKIILLNSTLKCKWYEINIPLRLCDPNCSAGHWRCMSFRFFDCIIPHCTIIDHTHSLIGLFPFTVTINLLMPWQFIN